MPILDTTLTSRYELKYLLPESRLPQLRSYFKPFMRLDQHAHASATGRYGTTSLYLDTADLACFAAGERGDKNRFKLRIRTYGEGAEAPAFMEVKKRADRLVRKSRAKVTREAANELVGNAGAWISGYLSGGQRDLKEFMFWSQRAKFYPVVFVRYLREAYESTGPDPVRITFDSEIEFAIAIEASLWTTGLRWQPVPLDEVIFELKFSDRCPSWAVEMVRHFQLERRSASKYGRTVGHLLGAGVTLPALLLGQRPAFRDLTSWKAL